MDNPQAAPELLVKFRWDCGRMGHVEGLFVTTQPQLDAAFGKYVSFGEILGKHSDIGGTLETGDITVVTADQDFIGKLATYVGRNVGGYNPLDYIDE